MSEMPEIDAVLGVGSFGDIVSAARRRNDGAMYKRLRRQQRPH